MTRRITGPLVVFGIFVGCDPSPEKKDDAQGTSGGTDWTLYDDTAAPSQPTNDSAPEGDTLPDDSSDVSSDPWGRDLSCPQPTECISLAEAIDRDFASVMLNNDLIVENFGPYAICSGRWHTFFSEGSQDAIAGHSGVDWPSERENAFKIDPDDYWAHLYARSSTGPAWWCIERTQVTQNGASYRFTGARAPYPLLTFVHTNTDTNDNGVEDHSDYADSSTGAPWTNHNIWDHLAEQATYVVGRTRNYVELQPGTSTNLTIEVVNLGRDTSNIMVEETLPAGTRSFGFSVLPSTSESNADGSTTHTWYFKMGGSVDDPDLSSPTQYDMVQIDYQVAWERADCGYREKGEAPTVTWTDSAGGSYTSSGTELVLVCCDGT